MWLAMEEKKCFKCGKTKPISEFYTHPSMSDGHLNKCKECTRKDVSEHKKNNPDMILRTRLSVCEKNPTKYNAHKVVEAAINAGVIEKPDHCFGCGRSASETRISSHHHDYAKPLEVIWVCAKCHRPLDANRREREGLKPYERARAVIMVYDGMEVCKFQTIAEAAKAIGRKPPSVSQCLSGKSKTSGGVSWKYEEAVS